MNKRIKSWVHGTAMMAVMGVNAVGAIAPAGAQATGDRLPQNQYDAEVVTLFMGGCVENGLAQGVPAGFDATTYESLLTDLCGCMIWEIQDRYTQAEALVLTEALGQDEDWANEAIAQVVSACAPG